MPKQGRKATWQSSDGAYDLPPSGRELDAEIAEKVMGFRRVDVPRDYDGKNAGQTLVPPGFNEKSYQWTPKGAYALTAFVPHYSTSIADALSVAEHLRKTKGLGYVIGTNGMALQQNGVKFFEGFHGAGHSIFDAEPHPGWYRVAETIPLALCRAALAYAESRRPAPQTE